MRMWAKWKQPASRSGKKAKVTVKALRARIARLKADPPVGRPGIWYLTQKEHWLGWLRWYNTKGAYGRIPSMNRDARFAYNHVVCPDLLFWLAKAAGVSPTARAAGQRAVKRELTLMGQAGAFRRHVSWDMVEQALWPARPRRLGTSAKRSRAPH